ncbi:hypothetical protein [Halobaculum lipolyticum]|uniref:Uncharacterized protein n=1 Tax=Halobaculum lipolyticum TaxID=3032001 RepID=A0ABD5WHW7_9EURY|nr:hypothetical protein [Halobaculum sp. DT31]
MIAAGGALAVVVLAVAVGGLAAAVGPGAPPDPGGRRLGNAIVATLVCVILSWLLVVARVVHGAAGYAADGDRPRGVAFGVAAVEGTLAFGTLVVAVGAVALSVSAGETEVLAVGAYAVVAVGVVLAAVSVLRAGVALFGRP